MTREELKKHCLKQIEGCEMWAKHNGEEPHGKVYEEHKLILELLEQESVLDKVRAEIKGWQVDIHDNESDAGKHDFVFERIFEIIDKHKEESESEE